MKKNIKMLLIPLLILTVFVSMIFFYFHRQEVIKLNMSNGKTVTIKDTGKYKLTDGEPLLLGTYPSMLTFKYDRYTINVVECLDSHVPSFIQNSNLIAAQSEVMNSILTMGGDAGTELYESNVKEAEEFMKEYENIYPNPDYKLVHDDFRRFEPYTDFGYFDDRINPIFQGCIVDVRNYKGKYIAVIIYDDYYEEDVKLDECEFMDVINKRPTGFFEEMKYTINNISDYTVGTYNSCVYTAEKLRKRMEQELDLFESYMDFNQLFNCMYTSTFEFDAEPVLNDYIDSITTNNDSNYYMDDSKVNSDDTEVDLEGVEIIEEVESEDYTVE